jgi:molecular chaperone DnaK
VEMKSAVDVDDSAVQEMVEESVEHAFEDLAARRWIEARLKANELISATRAGLADCAAELDSDYIARVNTALQAVESALASEDPNTKTGNTKQLQAACATLDEVTKPLAELLMDKVTETLLRKRGLTS